MHEGILCVLGSPEAFQGPPSVAGCHHLAQRAIIDYHIHRHTCNAPNLIQNYKLRLIHVRGMVTRLLDLPLADGGAGRPRA
jgi:hypothetical protein